MEIIIYFATAAWWLTELASSTPLSCEIFSESDQGGESLRVTKTHTDISCNLKIIGGTKSRCETGAWLRVYEGVEFSYLAAIWPPRCLNEPNGAVRNVTALYRVGPDDTSTPAIAFHRRLQITVVEKIAEANLDYPPHPSQGIRFCTYGYSNWTLFSEPNFEGISQCVSHSREMDCFHNGEIEIPSVGSTIRGCDLPTETIAKMKENLVA